ncbi:MAG: class II glutamine amidotransferase [Candidatus Aminicenantales bacterium]
MCRFLMVKSQVPVFPEEILFKFAEMAERSKAPDGDWQGDGWGVSWLDREGNWQELKSISPMWEEMDVFSKIPESRLFLAHARSASFPQHKKILAYNQPFVQEPFVFVFNGLLKEVSFSYSVPGKIGAQKIWNILLHLLKKHNPREGLEQLSRVLRNNARRILALNLGLCDKTNFYVYGQYAENPGYYHLQFFDTASLKMVCSEPLEGYEFRPVPLAETLAF